MQQAHQDQPDRPDPNSTPTDAPPDGGVETDMMLILRLPLRTVRTACDGVETLVDLETRFKAALNDLRALLCVDDAGGRRVLTSFAKDDLIGIGRVLVEDYAFSAESLERVTVLASEAAWGGHFNEHIGATFAAAVQESVVKPDASKFDAATLDAMMAVMPPEGIDEWLADKVEAALLDPSTLAPWMASAIVLGVRSALQDVADGTANATDPRSRRINDAVTCVIGLLPEPAASAAAGGEG